MLPEFFKFHIINNTGVTIQFSTDGANNTFTITGKGWKFNSGAIEYGSEQTVFADPSTDLTDGADLEGAEYDNSTNLFAGMHFVASLVTDASVDGSLDIYYEYSTSDSTGGTFPSDAGDFDENVLENDLIFVGSIVCTSTDDDRSVNFEL